MGKVEITLPAMGEGIIEATVTRWLVNEGDYVEMDQPIIEVATDKVDSEIPSPIAGKIHKIIFNEGEIPKVGEVLVIIEDESIQTENNEQHFQDISYQPSVKILSNEHIMKKNNNAGEGITESENYRLNSEGKIISPFIRFMAKNREISYDELLKIQGSGLNGRLTKDDLNNYIISGRRLKTQPIINNLQNGNNNNIIQPESIISKPVLLPGEEIIEMDRTRKIIAANMVNSKRISPHVTSMIEMDVTAVVNWRKERKDDFYNKYGAKLTYTPLMVMATVKALKDYPGINVSVSGDNIIIKKYFNIGVATALPDGNLIVPVIKEADKRSFSNIVLSLSDLAERARKGKLEPTEIKGGTFTITNLGPYENISGTPIINQPEVAILAVGAIKRKPWIVVTGEQETIGIRDIMILSLTYDHRVIDGSLGGSFVKAIGEYFVTDLPDF